jgi:alanyl-tRNA synthetase
VVSFLSEGSIGAGVRRVEALVGADAYRFLAREHSIVSQLAELTKVRAEELPDRIGKMMERLRNAEREINKARSAALMNDIMGLLGEPAKVSDTHVYRFTAPAGTESSQLREIVTNAKGKVTTSNYIIVAAVVEDDKASVVTATDSAARESGVAANAILQSVMVHLEGKGGGNAEMAQGGGSKVSGLDAAFIAALEAVKA